jgi:hypothetical protein
LKAIKEGYLQKKNARNRWKRRFIVLSDNAIYFFKSAQDKEEPKRTVSLLTSSVKMYIKHKEGQDARYGFQIFCKVENKLFMDY